jgi:outer membrane protein
MPVSRLFRSSALVLILLGTLLSTSARSETLLSAFRYAYLNNPNIMSALLGVKSAAEDVALRKSNKRPSIAASADYLADFSVVDGSSDWQQSAQVGLSLRQNLFDNHRTDSAVEAARAVVELQMYALRNEEQNVLLSVANAYISVVRDIQLIQVRQENVSFFEAQVSSAQERLRIGEGTRLEVSQAEARLAMTVAAYQAAITSLQTSQASYERWVGHAPRNLSLTYLFDSLLPEGPDSALSLAEGNHPAILSAKAAIRAAQAGVDAANAEFGPTIDLIGSLCAINCFGGSTIGVAGSVRLTLSVPIYQGGAIGASVRKANIEQIKSEVDALSTRDQVREAVTTAWATLQDAMSQITSAQSGVVAGQAVLDSTLSEREAGLRTSLDVLNARAELTTARERLIQARATRHIAVFALIAATGKLSAEDLGLGIGEHTDEAEVYAATVEDVWAELRALD